MPPLHGLIYTPLPTQQESATAAATLQLHGPRIQIAIAVTDAVAAQLMQQGQIVPTPIVGWALIDTGASNTSIDDQAAVQLGLQPINRIQLSTPAGNTPHNVYPARLAFPGTHLPTIVFQPVTGVDLANQGLVALLGRDFLYQKTLHYDGAFNIVTLSW